MASFLARFGCKARLLVPVRVLAVSTLLIAVVIEDYRLSWPRTNATGSRCVWTPHRHAENCEAVGWQIDDLSNFFGCVSHYHQIDDASPMASAASEAFCAANVASIEAIRYESRYSSTTDSPPWSRGYLRSETGWQSTAAEQGPLQSTGYDPLVRCEQWCLIAFASESDQ